MGRITAALIAALALVVIAAAPAAAQDYQTVTGKTEPVYTKSTLEEFYVPTAHGRIYGWVRRPVVPAGVKVPIILTYSPYQLIESTTPGNEGLPPSPDGGTGGYYVPRGYARAFFHLVGTGASEGCYDHGGIRERQTAKDVVDFLGAQSWSNGKVGMIGGSYDGTTQWAAAIERPKHLAALIPQVAISRWYDYAFLQGVRIASGSATPTAFDFGFNFGVYDPTNPTAVVDSVKPCEQVDHNEKAFAPDPVYDKYWDERDYLARAGEIQVPALIQSSWIENNVYPQNSMSMWDALKGRVPLKLHMGLAGHSDNQVEDHSDIEHAWFDRYLYGLDTGVDRLPAVDSIDPATKTRRQESTWPPPNTRRVGVALGTGEGPGTLGLGDEDNAWTDTDPQRGDPTAKSATSIVFVGQPVKEAVRIAGRMRLEATVVSDKAETFLTPVVFDEDGQGARRVIARGALNSRNRDGERVSTPVTPGEPWRGVVDFLPTDYILEAGHRLGLGLASMSTDIALYNDTSFATNELALEASRLIVPTQFGRTALGAPEIDPPEPVALPPAPPAPPAPVVTPIVKKPAVTLTVKRRGRRITVTVRSAAKLPALRLTVLNARKKVVARGKVRPGARRRTIVLRTRRTVRGALTIEARGTGIVVSRRAR